MKNIFALIIGVFILTGAVPLHTAQAASPRIEVESEGRNRYKITVSNAPSYSSVDLYYHQSDSDLWNATLNIGWTDRNGKFSTTRTFNSFHPELAWIWYADINGWTTPTVSTNGRTGTVYGDSTFENGALVADNGTVYIIYRDEKSGFASSRVFEQLGFDWSDVVNGNTSNYPLTYIVTSGTRAHPWGSWIKSGNTTYFVHEDGLIPVPSTDILRDNGGKTGWIVPANSDDKRLRKLSNMKMNDSRLK